MEGGEGSDLNGLSDDELQARKATMEKTFEKHRLKAGDKGFEYDKRADFKVGQ